jgi:hypothetical protein
MKGWTDRKTDIIRERWKDGQTDRQNNKLLKGWRDIKQTNLWTEGKMDRQIYRQNY